MAQQESKPVVIETTRDKVVLKIGAVEVAMTPSFARELGDKLYRCGCDVAQTAVE